MSIWGKIIGGAAGLALGGPLGAILGTAAGHAVDRLTNAAVAPADGDSAEKHHDFYDEYMSVMDLTAEFYLQSVERVFVNHDLPNGTFNHRGRIAKPAAIKSTALMTIEGERDDISGLGQTEDAHDLCTGLKAKQRVHHVEPKVGHYGVFNGRRFQANIAPRIVDFIRSNTR